MAAKVVPVWRWFSKVCCCATIKLCAFFVLFLTPNQSQLDCALFRDGARYRTSTDFTNKRRRKVYNHGINNRKHHRNGFVHHGRHNYAATSAAIDQSQGRSTDAQR